MVKKIIDIVSPVAVSLKEKKGFFDKFKKGKPKKKRVSKTKTSGSKKKTKKGTAFNFNKLIIALSCLLALVIVFFVLNSRSKMEIVLRPRITPLEVAGDFSVSLQQKELDLESKEAGAKFFERTEEKWQVFKATGSDATGSKASGSVIVYNNQNPPRSFAFVAGTRFVSSEDGKTFKAKTKVSLPPAVLQGGKLVPGEAVVEVEAQDPGEAYNIAPSKFSVPGLSGTAFYYNIWAESTEAMKGGSSSVEKVVSQADLDQAADSLEEALEEEAQKSLVRFLEDGYILPDNSVLYDNFSSECFQKQGDKVAEFNCYGKIEAKGLALKYDDLLSFLEQEKTELTGKDYLILDKTLSLSVFAKSSPSQAGEAQFGFLAQTHVYQPIDEKSFLSAIIGKNKGQIEALIKDNYSQIAETKIKFWPFWLRKAPEDLSRINLKVEIDK